MSNNRLNKNDYKSLNESVQRMNEETPLPLANVPVSISNGPKGLPTIGSGGGGVAKLTFPEMLQNYMDSVESGDVEFNVDDLLALIAMWG